MVTLEDFKVGEPAYRVTKIHNKDYGAVVSVVKTGRLYVTIRSGRQLLKFRKEDFIHEALCEVVEWGKPSLLFTSEQSYKDYQEKKELEEWLKKTFRTYGHLPYTVDQLREVKRILEAKE